MCTSAAEVQVDDAVGSGCALGVSLSLGNLVDTGWIQRGAWEGNDSRLSEEPDYLGDSRPLPRLLTPASFHDLPQPIVVHGLRSFGAFPGHDTKYYNMVIAGEWGTAHEYLFKGR